MWGFSASSSLFVLQELGETGELEQAVETTSMGAQVKETPKMAFLIYVGNPPPKPTAKQEEVYVPYIHKKRFKSNNSMLQIWQLQLLH